MDEQALELLKAYLDAETDAPRFFAFFTDDDSRIHSDEIVKITITREHRRPIFDEMLMYKQVTA